MILLIALALVFLLGWFRGRNDLKADMEPEYDKLEKAIAAYDELRKIEEKSRSDFEKISAPVTEEQLFTKPESIRMLHCTHRNIHPGRFRSETYIGYKNEGDGETFVNRRNAKTQTVCFDCQCEVHVDRVEFYSVALILTEGNFTEDQFLQSNKTRYNQALTLLAEEKNAAE